MQQSQRAHFNHALELAIDLANEAELPLFVCFGLFERYPEANARHFAFLLEGLSETATDLANRGIRFVVRRARGDELALELGEHASAIVCDRGYLRHQKAWRAAVAKRAGKLVIEVESDVVVPVAIASHKQEFAARTLRPKVTRSWPRYLHEVQPSKLERDSLAMRVSGIDVSDPHAVLATLDVDASVAPVSSLFRGGRSQAILRLRRFLAASLPNYVENGARPETADHSTLSPYLHFGQISPLEVAIELKKREATGEDGPKFLDELLVRRELACNFCEYAADYDSYSAVPRWARDTLAEHARDPRPHVYSRRELEEAKTHDPYWNAAMREMQATGFLHNYMRMYWGKKILEWSAKPEEAFATTLALNNKYFLDGRDPNSYVNVAWLFGLHDRPWFQRPIFGTVRYMAASGLERKADTKAYLARVEERIAGARAPLAR